MCAGRLFHLFFVWLLLQAVAYVVALVALVGVRQGRVLLCLCLLSYIILFEYRSIEHSLTVWEECALVSVWEPVSDLLGRLWRAGSTLSHEGR